MVCTVEVDAKHLSLVGANGVRIVFLSVEQNYLTLGNFFILPDDDTYGRAPVAVLDMNGRGYVDLAPGYYHVYPTNPLTGVGYPPFVVLVPDTATARLINIIVDDAVPGTPGGGVGVVIEPATFIYQSAVGDGTASPIPLQIEVPGKTQVDVFLDGLRMHPDDYTASGTTLTPFYPIPEGVRISIRIARTGTINSADAKDVLATSGLSVQEEIDRRPVDFPSRAAAIATTIPAPVIRITVRHAGEVQTFDLDATGTALTTNSGTLNWSPSSDATVAHWGATGTLIGVGLTDTLVTTIPTVDETTILQAAMNWCLNNGRDLRGSRSRVYGVTGRLYWAERVASGIVPVGFPTLSDLNLCCIGGTWTPGVKTDPDVNNWTFGNPVLTVGSLNGKYKLFTERISINGNHIAAGGIWYRGAAGSIHSDNTAYFCVDYHQRDGNKDGSEGNANTDAQFINCRGLEWSFSSEVGDPFNDLTQRTAVGLSLEGADTSHIGGTYSGCKHAHVVRGNAPNGHLSVVKFWNGPVRTDPNSVTAIIGSGSNNITYSACRFDDGRVRVERENTQIEGCRLMQFTHGQLELVALTPNQTWDAFIFDGNRVTGSNSALLTTRDTGSWTEFRGVCANSTGTNAPFSIGSVGRPRGLAVTVADDAVATVNLVRNGGWVTVTANGGDGFTGILKNFSGLNFLDMGTSPDFLSGINGADFNVTTGVLTGTTGVDGKVTISPQADGTFQIENRSAASITFNIDLG